jgi:hypothetical protein
LTDFKGRLFAVSPEKVDLGVLIVSAIVAFSLLYWALDFSLGLAVGITVVLTVVASVSMYFRNRNSS